MAWDQTLQWALLRTVPCPGATCKMLSPPTVQPWNMLQTASLWQDTLRPQQWPSWWMQNNCHTNRPVLRIVKVPVIRDLSVVHVGWKTNVWTDITAFWLNVHLHIMLFKLNSITNQKTGISFSRLSYGCLSSWTLTDIFVNEDFPVFQLRDNNWLRLLGTKWFIVPNYTSKSVETTPHLGVQSINMHVWKCFMLFRYRPTCRPTILLEHQKIH